MLPVFHHTSMKYINIYGLEPETHVLTLRDLHFQICAPTNDQQISNDHSTKTVPASIKAGLNMLQVMQQAE